MSAVDPNVRLMSYAALHSVAAAALRTASCILSASWLANEPPREVMPLLRHIRHCTKSTTPKMKMTVRMPTTKPAIARGPSLSILYSSSCTGEGKSEGQGMRVEVRVTDGANVAHAH